MRRLFNQQQKQALYWMAEGRCENCGIPLPNNWHADHIQPHAEGGLTDVSNGQALCPKCNLEKGSKPMLKQWPSHISLRRWQEQFLTKYDADEKPDFLLVATPGAGKTIASLKVAHTLINSGIVQRVVVVCPTDHLRTQWLHDAARVHIQLNKLQMNWDNQIALPSDYVGLVTTYAQVAMKADHLRAYTSKFKTLVLLDEIHHCGDLDHLTWGQAIRRAFDPAVRRLLLSGTPFRSDNSQIPYVPYVRDSVSPAVSHSKPDYTYGYGDALKDEEVVRHIVFPGWDGEFTWSDWYGEEKKASFQNPLNKTESGYRLRTAINASGQAMRTVLTKAHQKLDDVRRDGHTNAGGLVVAQDQTAAKTLAKIVEEVTGEKPILAISETGDEASAEISRFRDGSQKWIVAVKMVSEGVDIKRLRVGVYATNVTTDTFFRQVIGRVIRWDSKWNSLEDQTAWFYVPEDAELVRLMKGVKDEIIHSVEEKQDKEKQKLESQSTSPTMQIPMGEYEFRYSEGDEKNHHTSGETFPMSELHKAEDVFAATPGFERIPSAFKAMLLRNLAGNVQYQHETPPDTQTTPAPPPEYLRKKNLSSAVKTKVGRLVALCRQNNIQMPGNNPYQIINNAWGRAKGYSHQATNNEMESKLDWLDGLISRALDGDKSITAELR